MVEVVDHMLKAQGASEMNFAESEEKRIKLKGKMIESKDRVRRGRDKKTESFQL